MTCSKDTVTATGLNIWASGEHDDDEPQVERSSVIAVQGLGAHPYYTWVGKQGSAEKRESKHRHPFNLLRGRRRNAQIDELPDVARITSETAEVMWLRDLLPSLIPNARIATYSYESDWRKTNVKTSLRQCGEQLLNVLHQNRSDEKERQRSLIFIGHSLGGLIIKQALILANHGNDFRDIRLSAAGIIFLETSHQGSDAAVYGIWLAQAAGRDKTLLESLKRCSSDLHDIARDFEKSYGNLDMICFYENKEASHGPWRTQFVDQQSASLHGKRIMYLTTDHSELNKFHGFEDENFLLVQPEIQRMAQMSSQRVKERYRAHFTVTEESFHVPFSLQSIPMMNKFVARDAEMTQLTHILLPTSTERMRRKVFILHGLGGIGKTQLSVEFARKYQGNYSAIFWIDGSAKERVRRSIADLASRLPQHQISEESRSYSQKESTNVDQVVGDVLKWLSRSLNGQWLLIFDNVDREFSISSIDSEAFDMQAYFPMADQGSILITSRLTSLRNLGDDMKLEPVNELQGESILKNSAGRSVKDSLELVKLLQGLSLAINQAGSYMRETGTTVSKYIDSYNHKWKKLMKDQNYFTLRESADRSVLTTWTVSFDHLREQNEDAVNFLKLWAFLDNQDLWYELLTPSLHQEVFDEVPGWFVRCASDELDFKKCMGLLSKYSFINTKFESSSFFMHSVLHHWCLHAFEKDNAIMSWLAVVVVASAVPSKTMPDYSLLQRRLLPHCDRVFSLLQQSIQEAFNDKADIPSVSAACHRLGDLYSDQGKMTEAEDMYLRALTGSKKAWGPAHTSTLDTVGNLGNLYSKQGRMKEAEDMYLRALTGFEQAWGSAHTSTLDTVNNLGVLYSKQGRMKEAEDMYLRALTGFEQAWGSAHTSTLDTVNNLGNLYSKQGKMKEAEDMYLRALTGFEQAWGSAHTSTLDTVNNLGILYKNQGKMKEAEDMYLRALTGYEQAWGSEHKKSLDARYNLAFLYKKMATFENAAKHFELVVQGYIKILGSDHWETVDASNQLKRCEVLNENPRFYNLGG